MQKVVYGGLDLGGTSLKYGLVTHSNEVIFNSRVKTGFSKSTHELIKMILSVIDELQKRADKMSYVLLGVGLGTPGSVNIKTGQILGKTPNFTDWGNISLTEEIESVTKLPFYVDNDANLAALGEYEVTLKNNFKNIIYITLGTGIGGGIILEGQLFRGAHFCGSEVGHMSIDFYGLECNCGRRGCWEQYASAAALVRFYNLRSSDPVKSAYEFFLRVEKQEPLALSLLDEFYQYLSSGLANLVNIFDPEAVVIGGGISESPHFKEGKIKELVMEKIMIQNPIVFQKAKLGNKAGIIGAACFAKNMVKNK